MNAPEVRNIEIPTVIGTPTELGVYFGRIRAAGALHALFQPPMAIARRAPAPWNASTKRVEDACSFSDGHANTTAMAKAGSEIAQYALDNGLYIPSLDEADLQYRVFKSDADKNICWNRDGINLSAESPLEPYTPDFPAQTALEAYREGGPEAFEKRWHWTSTQHRAYDDSAWVQLFGGGLQLNYLKGYRFSVVLVRRLIIR